MIGALLVHVFVVGIGPPSVAATVLMSGVLFVGWSWSGAGKAGRAGWEDRLKAYLPKRPDPPYPPELR